MVLFSVAEINSSACFVLKKCRAVNKEKSPTVINLRYVFVQDLHDTGRHYQIFVLFRDLANVYHLTVSQILLKD